MRGGQLTTIPPTPRVYTTSTARQCTRESGACPEWAKYLLGTAGAIFSILSAISLDKVFGGRRVKNFLDSLPEGYVKVFLEHLVYFLQVL